MLVCYDMTHANDVIRECGDRTPTLESRMGTGGNQVPLVCIPIDTRNAIRRPTAVGGSGIGENGDPSFTISAQGKVPSVCIPLNLSPLTRVNSEGADGIGRPGEPSPCLGTTVGGFGVAYAEKEENTMTEETAARVRRLTPVECERLQGFPDNWTRIPYRGKPADKCPDAPRYKAIGNSWAVPVVRWIGRRIERELERTQDAGNA